MIAKRTFDFWFSLILLIVFSPIFLLIAILIKTTSSGPIFFPAKRIEINRRNGDRRRNNTTKMEKDRRVKDQRKSDLYGKIFYMMKFRTMVQDADKLGATVTSKGDPRITKVGAILRKTKLDELPSLVNVLKGEMSFVGPRPETPDWIEYYSQKEKEVLKAKPGITGNAQIKYRNEEDLLNRNSLKNEYIKIMRDKLALDLNYMHNWTFTEDIIILFRTVLALFSPLKKLRFKFVLNFRTTFFD